MWLFYSSVFQMGREPWHFCSGSEPGEQRYAQNSKIHIKLACRTAYELLIWGRPTHTCSYSWGPGVSVVYVVVETGLGYFHRNVPCTCIYCINMTTCILACVAVAASNPTILLVLVVANHELLGAIDPIFPTTGQGRYWLCTVTRDVWRCLVLGLGRFRQGRARTDFWPHY